MDIVYSSQAKKDLAYWKKVNPKLLERINQLLEDIQLHPKSGIGKPEALRFQQSGYWSRRIDREHQLVYKVSGGRLYVVQCRYHY